MRYPAGHKERTRAKILRAAGRAFRRQGYHATGVDKVMEEAGLTPGGFYAHFGSKETLFAEALRPAAADAPRGEAPGGESGRAWAEAFLERYLSPAHRDGPEAGCPLPALVSEVSRAGEAVKSSFEAIVRALADRLRGPSGDDLSEDRALAIVALCVGGLGLARSVQGRVLSERILEACRDLARAGLVEGQAATSSKKPAPKRKAK